MRWQTVGELDDVEKKYEGRRVHGYVGEIEYSKIFLENFPDGGKWAIPTQKTLNARQYNYNIGSTPFFTVGI